MIHMGVREDPNAVPEENQDSGDMTEGPQIALVMDDAPAEKAASKKARKAS